MCGILASIAPLGEPSRELQLPLLRHRGPDGEGLATIELSFAVVTLGMTRLKIVDRRDLPLPFRFGPRVLAFNGEIYNHAELRVELDRRGWDFETTCDAEVLAHGYAEWGIDVLHRLNGMWAFVLVDTEADEIFIARDRAGEKPLYWTTERPVVGDLRAQAMPSVPPSVLYFASEAKALPVPKRERVGCRELATFEADCTGESAFEGMHHVAPGAFVQIDKGGTKSALYFKLPPSPHVKSRCYNADIDTLATVLTDAIELRAKSEVPLGVMLSGGLDSAIIQAVVKSDRLYTVTFPEIDNMDAAVSAGGPGRQPIPVTFGYQELLHELPRIVYHLDTPATWSAVCQWFLFRRMRQDGIVVALSGEGADELFLGYARYRILDHHERMREDPCLGAYRPLIEHLCGRDDELAARMLDRSDSAYGQALVLDLLAEEQDRGLVERVAAVEWRTTMQILLRMADRMSAAFGMENRSPFFDPRVIELALKLPVEWKMGPRGPKQILRDVALALGVPRRIAAAEEKRGLALPWSSWTGLDPLSSRGKWERRGFADLMKETWRAVFFRTEERS